MKLLLTFFGAFCCTATSLYAQSAKSVYVELGGPGLASVNYDTRFTDRESGIGGRIGIGGFSVEGIGLVTFPLAVNYLMGKDQRHYFEIGAGYTPLIGGDDGDDPFSGSFGHLHFGYRLQPVEGGFTFRAGITPIFGSWGFLPYYFSISFGYKF